MPNEPKKPESASIMMALARFKAFGTVAGSKPNLIRPHRKPMEIGGLCMLKGKPNATPARGYKAILVWRVMLLMLLIFNGKL